MLRFYQPGDDDNTILRKLLENQAQVITGQLSYAAVGGAAGLTEATANGLYLRLDGTNEMTGELGQNFAAAASTPMVHSRGAFFTGGTSTTTKPAWLLEPAGTTSDAWSTAGTGLGVNAPSGFTGNLADFQVDGVSWVRFPTTAGLGFSTRGTLSFGNGTGNANAQATFVGDNVTLGNFGATIYAGFAAAIFGSTGGSARLYGATGYSWEMRHATNPHTLRIYSTYTDASNYERLAISGNTITAETAGTGADNISLTLTAAGTGDVIVASPLRVNNAAVAETPTPTHTITVKDSTGTVYRIPCLI